MKKSDKRQAASLAILMGCMVIVGVSIKIGSSMMHTNLANNYWFLGTWILSGFGSGHMAMSRCEKGGWTTEDGITHIVLGPVLLLSQLIIGWLDGRWGKPKWKLL